MVKKILNVTFWVLFVILLAIWIIDFVKLKNEKEPIFCIKKEVHKYDDGTVDELGRPTGNKLEVDECLGLGYRIFNYNRSSLPKGRDFAPFFIKMRVE